MRPDTQATLFEMQPIGQEPPIAERKITPGCLLPIAPNMVVDVPRVASILGVVQTIVVKLLKAGRLQGYQLRPNHAWRISYASVVEFCDQLRIEHGIRDRRAKLRPGMRRPDVDLLPFPMHDTIEVSQAMIALDEMRPRIIHLLEDGSIEAYRFFDGSPWRVSKTSLFEFGERKRREFEGSKAVPKKR